PAEDGVEERGGETAAVGARDARRAEAEVVLLRLLLLEAESRAGKPCQRPADARTRPRGSAGPALAPLQECDEPVVLQVSGCRNDDVPRCVGGAVVAGERPAADRGDDLGGTDYRS